MRISDWSSDVCSSDLDPPWDQHASALLILFSCGSIGGCGRCAAGLGAGRSGTGGTGTTRTARTLTTRAIPGRCGRVGGELTLATDDVALVDPDLDADATEGGLGLVEIGRGPV